MKKQKVVQEACIVDVLTSPSFEDILGFKQLKTEEQKAKLALMGIDQVSSKFTYTLLVQATGYKEIKT